MWWRVAIMIAKGAARSAPAIATASGILLRIGAGSVRAPIRFVRSIFNPRAGEKVLNAEQKTFVRDITPITRSAMQIRATPRFVMRQTYNFARYYAPRKALAETRKIIRDVLSPLYTSIHAYQFYRLTRVASARTSAIERSLDRALWGFSRAMRPLKLTPKFSYTIRSYVRIAAAGTVYHEFETLKHALQAGYGRVKKEIGTEANRPQLVPSVEHKIIRPVPTSQPTASDTSSPVKKPAIVQPSNSPDRRNPVRRPVIIQDKPIIRVKNITE